MNSRTISVSKACSCSIHIYFAKMVKIKLKESYTCSQSQTPLPPLPLSWPKTSPPIHPELATCSHTACITALDRSLIVPLPRASFFRWALNTCSSFFSSSLKVWQYRTFTEGNRSTLWCTQPPSPILYFQNWISGNKTASVAGLPSWIPRLKMTPHL